MRREIVHMIGAKNGAELSIGGSDVKTRCGKIACPVSGVPTRYHLIDIEGNKFEATTRTRFVSCEKCINLLTVGTIHDKSSRTAVSAQRAVDPADRGAGASRRRVAARARLARQCS